MNDLDPVLSRQLRKLSLDALDHPPDLAAFQALIRRINDSYKRYGEDRDLLSRSLELSTQEMTTLHSQLQEQRDKMEQVVIAVGDALSVFYDIAREKTDSGTGSSDVTGMLTLAKRRFASRMSELFGAEQAASSWEEATLATHSHASIEGIRRSFLGLADQLASLLQQTVQVAAIRKELEVAGAVQQMLLPFEDTLSRPHLLLAASFVPAAECGGDWWTAHDLPDGRTLVLIGDVTGHGASSAIVTGVAKGACDVARRLLGPSLEPDQLLTSINAAIYEAGKQRYMMSALAAVVDADGRGMTVANAGHAFPYLVRRRELQQLVVRGSPLGAVADAEFHSTRVALERDDTLVFFTDGVTECEAPDGSQFSDRRLRQLCGDLSHLAPPDIRTEILRSLQRFRGSQPALDDVTFVIGRVA
ncbi:MAG: serine/threonine-protein phosphatase [Alphaproteobacteria bacterium]|nr:serine/threonine-protein phosphatase [Alphaproteobacteria bacterium]MCB9696750.1 serine/threonine-protein phosphatase [Alphaproteobacteria bacterium]